MARATAAEPAGYVVAIDGLRAVAVASVMLFHLIPRLLPGGFVGVDVFFVISGFVVTRSLANKHFDSLWDLISYFYVRRILRIIPALVVMLLVAVALFVAIVPESWLSKTSNEVAKGAFLGVSNIVLALQTEDYFAPRPSFNPFTHTWSLGVEEQFYLIFPFLLFWHLRQQRVGRSTSVTLLAVALMSAASLLLCAWLTRARWPFAFYLMPARLWELGVGMLLCLTVASWRPRVAGSHPRLRAVLPVAALGAIAIAYPIPASTRFPFPLAILPVLGTALAIVQACALPQARLARALSHRWPVAIGKRSYSLYLWHWPVFVFMRWTVGLESLATAIAGLGLTFIAAEVSYRFVELGPLRRRIANAFPRWKVIGVGVTLIAASGASAHFALNAQRRLSLSQTAADARFWYPDSAGLLNRASARCAVDFAQRPFSDGAVRIWTPQRCTIARPHGRLLVIGDSHSLAYMPMFEQFAADEGREVRSYHLSDCAFVNVKDPIGDDPACRRYYDALREMLGSQTRAGDVVFLASLKMPRLANQTGALNAQTPAERRKWIADVARASGDLVELSHMLQGRGLDVVVEAPKPVFRSPTFRCADWFNRRNPVCAPGFSISRSELEAIRAPVVETIGAITRAEDNVLVWDPFPLLCPRPTCHAFRNGHPLVIDADHLSAYADALLYPSFRRRMADAFGRRGRGDKAAWGPAST